MDVVTDTETTFRSINTGYAELPVESLDPHPLNPNRGDLAIIEESMDVNGFYGAVTVRISPDDPRRYQILAGEHRWRAATKKGADYVPAIVVEADDVEAARIMLVDNESAKRSTYDASKLDVVLQTIGSVEGTGFDLAPLEEFEDARHAEAAAGDEGDAGDDEKEFVREYGVVIIIEDEAQQRELYEEMRERGFNVRVASI